MIKTLSAGAIGVKVESMQKGVELAHAHGFDGYEFDVREVRQLVSELGAEQVRHRFDELDVVPVVFGLPVDWRGEANAWRSSLRDLAAHAAAAAAIGCHRTATWVMPGSNDRDREENLRFHVERFRPIAEVLAEHSISLGLEFIGPKTLRDTLKYPFVHTMDGMLEMASEIGENVGLLLDAYHWHTSGSTVEELRFLRADQVVYVHVNDAIAGVPLEELQDGTRRLPGETGVIDLHGFIGALREIGFDGPVAVEPFKKELADLPSDDARLQVVSESLERTLAA